MNKKSIYITLTSLCAVACAFTVVAVNTTKTQESRNEALRINEEIVKNDISEPIFSENTVQKEEINEESNESKENTENENKKIAENVQRSDETNNKPDANEEILVSQNELPVIASPVENGEILNNFTDSVLVFNETYGDYRTHNGVDITAKKDTPVNAVKKGIVTKNEFDYEDGYTVEIEHDDGLVSVYKNLSNDKTVKVGQVVDVGETIGTVGDTAVSESGMESHLHFEIREDDVEVDPTNYIAFSN